MRWLSVPPRVLCSVRRKSRRLRFYRSTWQTTFCIRKMHPTLQVCDGSQRVYHCIRPRAKLLPGGTPRRHCGSQWPAGEGDFRSRQRRWLVLERRPPPGYAIADTVRNALAVDHLRNPEKRRYPDRDHYRQWIGQRRLRHQDLLCPPTTPGGHNFAITGGTGAFLGARGQIRVGCPRVRPRNTSITEDPANRRRHGGGTGTWRWIAHVIPMSAPQVVTSADGPAVFHSDFTPVTAARPAKSGEVLIVQATGLGPTVPGVDPGQPFPTDANLPVNSPLSVKVNGQDAEVVSGVGWPGLVDTYRVDFRVPSGMVAGTASVQLSAAWITGNAVQIAVQ